MDDVTNIILKKLEKIDEKLDNGFSKSAEKFELINGRLSTMESIQVKHDENLKEHMNRSLTLENDLKNYKNTIDNEFKPINEHINNVKGVGKALTIFAACLAIISILIKLI